MRGNLRREAEPATGPFARRIRSPAVCLDQGELGRRPAPAAPSAKMPPCSRAWLLPHKLPGTCKGSRGAAAWGGHFHIAQTARTGALGLLGDRIIPLRARRALQPCLKREGPNKIHLLNITTSLTRRRAAGLERAWKAHAGRLQSLQTPLRLGGHRGRSWLYQLAETLISGSCGGVLTCKRVEISHVLRSTSRFPVCKQQGPLRGLHLSDYF